MSRESILKSIGKTGPEKVEVPEWGTTVSIKRFTVAEWTALFSNDDDDFRAFAVLAAGILDEAGKPLFSLDDIKAMPSTQSAILLRLFDKCRSINGDQTENGGDDTGKKS